MDGFYGRIRGEKEKKKKEEKEEKEDERRRREARRNGKTDYETGWTELWIASGCPRSKSSSVVVVFAAVENLIDAFLDWIKQNRRVKKTRQSVFDSTN